LLEREAPLRERAEAVGFERDEVAAFERDELLRDDPPTERDEPLDLVLVLAGPLTPLVEFSLCPPRAVDLLLLAIPNPLSSQIPHFDPRTHRRPHEPICGFLPKTDHSTVHFRVAASGTDSTEGKEDRHD
jgi:hypothetical protein